MLWYVPMVCAEYVAAMGKLVFYVGRISVSVVGVYDLYIVYGVFVIWKVELSDLCCGWDKYIPYL